MKLVHQDSGTNARVIILMFHVKYGLQVTDSRSLIELPSLLCVKSSSQASHDAHRRGPPTTKHV